MESKDKEVFFNLYCRTCKYENKPEDFDRCNECLANPSNVDSHKPVNWEEK